MLQFDKVTLELGEAHWHFDIGFDTQGCYAIMGKSGAGKSTLLNLVGGFLHPAAGDIRWHGASLLPLPPHQRPVTTLFQHDNLFDHLDVRQNIGLGIDPALKLSAGNWEDVDAVLDDVGLAGYQSRLPGRLSGGERQRVALARCLLREQPILLLDEPFTGLDQETRESVTELMRTLIDRLRPCVLMVTHDIDEARALSAEVLRIENGRLIPQTVASRPQRP
ncbi:MAG: thiamine ABC transporter ATP-binding protein [Gammaproteobacteria bacterium]|nr:MAG: thiamine ABC transporter ATP-binding protein [Gammaproteobacteria bacterium]PIE36890.1 MAG: thiamine ABC transporter ATP-binding protein [Gammaproteobacteria bacterium]